MSITLRRPSDPPSEGGAGPGVETPPTGNPAVAPAVAPAGTEAPGSPRKRRGRPAGSRQEDLHIGGEPRVDLLPPEVRTARRDRRLRRAFGWGVLVVALVMVLAVGAAFAFNIGAQARLIGARLETTDLLTQQQQYAEVREVQRQVALAEAAQQVGAATEIDWNAFLQKVQSVQPAGVTLKSVSVDSASPIAVYQQSTDPLQGPRVGTVAIEAYSPTLPDVAAWVSALEKVDGVVDAVPGATNFDATTNQYVASVTVHVGEALYTKRFQPKGK
ncbi:hypothetical protein P5G50_17460 [Leifsonia sp. F6_8S_P_1B]|uniref:Tfp pilus assembly protein PilN n=1 Tax=Leifsonia williamsii TaxID=3035919 RepID=A0ABT8KFM1_9MICO|nr:hypothetical protein [Leifsonia williamsii]MDN4616240.1 hypothetical protein [Leifsonia williamsii]